MNVLLASASSLYGAATRYRRRWYARHPSRQRRLGRPVISIGNLRVGGTGKTPIVEAIARLLVEHGERPAVLTRGYGRRGTSAAVVVSDASSVLVDVEHAGDEPLMLARHLPGVAVLVGADRYQSGLVAEGMGATVHVLDDGFQHLALARTIDLVAVGPDDLQEAVLPAGRLREPVDAAAAADGVLVTPLDADAVAIGRALGVDAAFGVARTIGRPSWIGSGQPAAVVPGEKVFALAAIARPHRFFDDVAAAGWQVAGTASFRDHHWFTAGDLDQVARQAEQAGATAIFTTEKDGTRLEACNLAHFPLPIAVVPLTATIEPAPAFERWLFERLHR